MASGIRDGAAESDRLWLASRHPNSGRADPGSGRSAADENASGVARTSGKSFNSIAENDSCFPRRTYYLGLDELRCFSSYND